MTENSDGRERMVRKDIALLCVGLFTLVVSFASVAQETSLVYCSAGPPEGFDPALYTSITTFNASSRQIYNRLVEFDRDTTELTPALAEEYLVSDDGLEYTFKLRSGIKFHTTAYFTPSRDLNASDVVFSFERQLLPDHPYNQVSGGTWEYFNSMSMPDLIDSIEAQDELTVKLTLTRPEAQIIANLAMDFASILSAEYAASLLDAGTPELLNLRPIGTGAFKFFEYEKDALIRYQSHDDYWRGRAAIDKLVFSITPDQTVGLQKLKAAECHVLGYPNPADIAAIREDTELTVVEQIGLNVGYLAYNTQVAPFDNFKVRKALNMSINKQAILDSVYNGSAIAAKNPIPPTIWSHDDTTPDDSYDPQTARNMLISEGVDKLEMQIWAMPVGFPYNPNAQLMAEMMREDLAKVGVEVEILTYEWGEYLKLSRELDRPGAVLLGWTGDNGDPNNFLAVLLGCDAVGSANRAQWCHEPFDDLIQQARVVADQNERALLYQSAQRIFNEQAPWATIAHSVVYKAVRKEVQNFRIDPFGGHVFYPVSLEP